MTDSHKRSHRDSLPGTPTYGTYGTNEESGWERGNLMLLNAHARKPHFDSLFCNTLAEEAPAMEELSMDIRHITDRIWLYGPDTWDGPLITRSGDERGRSTLALSLPGGRALIWAYRNSGGWGDDCEEAS